MTISLESFSIIFILLACCTIKETYCQCAPSWVSAGNYCYFVYIDPNNIIRIADAIRTCALSSSTLAIFPTTKDVTDFYNILWSNNNVKNYRAYFGYAHNVGISGLADVVSIYDGSPVMGYFTPGNPDYNLNVEWCVEILAVNMPGATQYAGWWNDIECDHWDNAFVCQQEHAFDNQTVTSVQCAPLCQAVGSKGHRFSTRLPNCINNGMVVENTTVGYAMTMYMDGLTDVIYEVNSTSGNTLMVYGSNGLSKLGATYSIANIFFVANKYLVNTMFEFALLSGSTNGTPDSLIVQYNSSSYKNLLHHNWTLDGHFYLFTRYPKSFFCPFATDCVWNKWQSWSSCSVSCAGGSRTRIRTKNVTESNYGICDNNSTETEACNTQPCPIDCEWSEWNPWSDCSVTCGGGEQNRTRTKVVVEQYGGYCNNNDTDVQICNTNHCPVDCVISNLSFTAPCSVTCGTGYELWSRSILVNASYGGNVCPNVSMDEHRYCNIPIPCFDWIIPVIQAFQCLIITCTVAVCFVLFLTFKVFSLERYLHMCQEACLITVHFLMSFFAWRFQTDKFNPNICLPNTILMQYFYLALFVFLLMESLQSYCIATNVISVDPFMSTKWYMAIGWGVPGLITAAMSIPLHNSYKSQYSCWQNWGNSHLAVWTPFLMIVFAYCCLIFLESATKQMCRPLPLLDFDRWTASIVSLYSMLFIVPLNLASWFVASNSIYHQNIYMHAAVVGINVTLGILTFKVHIAADEKVDDYVRKKLRFLKCTKRKD